MVGIDLLAQVAHIRLEHAGVAGEVVAPHVIKQLRAREDAARIEHQVPEQAVLGGGELDRLAGARHLARVLVELQVRERQPPRLLGQRARAAQDVAQAGDSSSMLNGLMT